MNESYIILLDDLKSGVLVKNWRVSEEFFGEFGNEEVSHADLSVDVQARRSGASVNLDADIRGTVTVPCDRCLEDVILRIDTAVALKLRFGVGSADADEEDGRELVWIPDGESEFDLSQTIYDYVCLSLPIRRCHADGECNPEVLRRMTDNPGRDDGPDSPAETNPFAALKDLFKD